MEQLILAALGARSGGDLVHRRNYKSGKLFCLAPGIHDMHAVARELAEERGHRNAKWMRRFDRAWRSLCDVGALEAPSLIPIAEVFRACRSRVHNLGDGAYIDGGRNRLYVRLTGRPASPPPPAAVCRECGVDLMTTHGLRKWCTACRAKLIKHRNVQTAAERLKRRRIQPQRGPISFSVRQSANKGPTAPGTLVLGDGVNPKGRRSAPFSHSQSNSLA
jgi:hypothetical protein